MTSQYILDSVIKNNKKQLKIMNPLFIAAFFLVIIGVIYFTYRISRDEKRKLIEELWTNKEISDETYRKYLKKF